MVRSIRNTVLPRTRSRPSLVPAARTPRRTTPMPMLTLGAVQGLTPYIRSFEVLEAVNPPTSCRLAITDPGASTGPGPAYADQINFGDSVIIRSPDNPTADPVLFNGRVYGFGPRQAQTGGPILDVTGYDRLQELAMARRSRSFEDIDASSVISTTAEQHGFRPDVALNTPLLDTIVQANESDLAFLVRLIQGYEGEIWTDEAVLYVRHRADRQGFSVTMPVETQREWAVFADLTEQRQGLHLHWWDIGGNEAMLTETGGMPANDGTGGTNSGAAILDNLGLTRVAPEDSVSHAIPEGGEEAIDRAAGRYATAARRFVTLRATGPGNARLRVGSTVTLQSVP